MKLLSFADVHAQFVFYLQDGRPVLLDEIVQFRTYRGLLLGLPREERASSLMDQAAGYAQAHFGSEPVPQVIPPELVEYEQVTTSSHLDKSGAWVRTDERPHMQRGKRLPLVTCMASLECPVPIKTPESIGVFMKSRATVVWFQEKFGLPAHDRILQCFRNLDWEKIAADVSD